MCHNLQEDTISINHNWFNAYNLSWVVSIAYAIAGQKQSHYNMFFFFFFA